MEEVGERGGENGRPATERLAGPVVGAPALRLPPGKIVASVARSLLNACPTSKRFHHASWAFHCCLDSNGCCGSVDHTSRLQPSINAREGCPSSQQSKQKQKQSVFCVLQFPQRLYQFLVFVNNLQTCLLTAKTVAVPTQPNASMSSFSFKFSPNLIHSLSRFTKLFHFLMAHICFCVCVTAINNGSKKGNSLGVEIVETSHDYNMNMR